MAPGEPSPEPSPEPDALPNRALPQGVLGWLELSSPRRLALFLGVCAGAAALTWAVPEDPALGEAARRALFMLLVAAGLWITEAIPAFAVGIGVIALQVLLLGDPRDPDGAWERQVLVLGHPLIWLFFGGLVLAAGMSRTGVDRWLALHALARFATRPRALVAAVAGIAFVLSMIMSNTATTAMMLALIAPLIADRDRSDRFAATLVLAVPLGANLGGMGSLVGTPPNAIAVGVLAEQTGTFISFARWFTLGLPPALLLAAALIGLLLLRLRGLPPMNALAVTAAGARQARAAHWEVLVVAVTLITTLGLWLTQDLHGLPTPVVAVVPVVLLTATGILDVDAFRRLSYDVLFLLAGGLALGQAIHDTGLAAWIVGPLTGTALPDALFVFLAGSVAVLLSNVMSNTAAANVLVPLVLSASVSAGTPAAITVALCASAAMALPVATPPNALAHATGRLAARDFLLIGTVSGVLTPLIATAWIRWMLS
ncbi:MAG: DASS family sodium-coupled anion symporter [Pseudomonadales bacterium]|jgi:sodium-dependent dicarboxylate transporter 2/3/5|nr:DASS family sodium-coupled anion symporter [Pseudomonadales bacterium]